MKLPPIEYEAPKTVSEAVELLAEHQDEASVLAGGQSLIPLLALRLARPAVLIDINGIDELSGVSAADGWVAIGAMTREYVAEESESVAGTVPLLAAALPLISHEAIRSRGTIGGSLAHADPAAELPAVAMALDAEFVVRGPAGERVRSEEHTSELHSPCNLVCRLLLEKKKETEGLLPRRRIDAAGAAQLLPIQKFVHGQNLPECVPIVAFWACQVNGKIFPRSILILPIGSFR